MVTQNINAHDKGERSFLKKLRILTVLDLFKCLQQITDPSKFESLPRQTNMLYEMPKKVKICIIYIIYCMSRNIDPPEKNIKYICIRK